MLILNKSVRRMYSAFVAFCRFRVVQLGMVSRENGDFKRESGKLGGKESDEAENCARFYVFCF